MSAGLRMTAIPDMVGRVCVRSAFQSSKQSVVEKMRSGSVLVAISSRNGIMFYLLGRINISYKNVNLVIALGNRTLPVARTVSPEKPNVP